MICYGHNGANPGLLRLKLPGITAQAKQIFSKTSKTFCFGRWQPSEAKWRKTKIALNAAVSRIRHGLCRKKFVCHARRLRFCCLKDEAEKEENGGSGGLRPPAAAETNSNWAPPNLKSWLRLWLDLQLFECGFNTPFRYAFCSHM